MKLVNIQTLRMGTATVLLAGLMGCQLANSLMSVNISDISGIQQSRSTDSIVYLKGNVGDRAPFLGSGAYKLQDSTGSIWVFSNRSLPNPGEELTIRGKVEYKSIPIAGTELGEVYINELEQVQRTSPSQSK